MPSDVEVLVAFTRTGEIVDSLPFTAWDWSESVSWSDAGTMSVTVPLTGQGAADRATVETLRSIRRAPWSLSLVMMADQRAVWAGPAVTLGWSGDEVMVGCPGIAAILDRRVLVRDGWRSQPWRHGANLSFALGTRDLVIELIRQGITGIGRDLPVGLPAQSGLAGPAVDYVGADLGTVHERVKQVVDRDDGPDVLITPDVDLAAGRLRWVVNVGHPRIGSPTSRATFDVTGSTLSLSGDVDASEAVSTGYVLGDSSDSTRLIGVAVAARGSQHPALERADRTSVSERRQEQLNALARSYVSDFSAPTETWSMTVDPDEWPQLGREWTLGDAVTVSVAGHPWLEDGDYLRRVIGVKVAPEALQLATVAA